MEGMTLSQERAVAQDLIWLSERKVKMIARHDFTVFLGAFGTHCCGSLDQMIAIQVVLAIEMGYRVLCDRI